jgi:2'-5' RNA ligase
LNKSTKLYFVAIIPPPSMREEVMHLKSFCAEKYASKAALRSPAHITLHMPFAFREDRIETLIATMKEIAIGQKSFHVEHCGFGCFEPRVIYIDVQLTEALAELRTHTVSSMRKKLGLLNADYKNDGFHPHMTIAFRDLKKPMFHKAWEEFENKHFEQSWDCNAISLLKHDGQVWHIAQDFPFTIEK